MAKRSAKRVPPMFWKLSMGPGASQGEFRTILRLMDCIRTGQVFVHSNTGAVGASAITQAESFADTERMGEYFFLCHGNESPSIILLGQFTGEARSTTIREREGWLGREFRWIQTSDFQRVLPRYVHGGWTPRAQTSFCAVPEEQHEVFEAQVLIPYFSMTIAELTR